MKFMIPTSFISFLLMLVFFISAAAQETIVAINPTCQKFLGKVSKLDRDIYFNIHNSGNDPEMKALMNDYNVNKGRYFWGPFGYAKNKTKQVGSYPFSKRQGADKVFSVSQNISTSHPKAAFN